MCTRLAYLRDTHTHTHRLTRLTRDTRRVTRRKLRNLWRKRALRAYRRRSVLKRRRVVRRTVNQHRIILIIIIHMSQAAKFICVYDIHCRAAQQSRTHHLKQHVSGTVSPLCQTQLSRSLTYALSRRRRRHGTDSVDDSYRRRGQQSASSAPLPDPTRAMVHVNAPSRSQIHAHIYVPTDIRPTMECRSSLRADYEMR